MADPMADLGGGGPQKADNASLTNTKEVFDPLVLGTNLQRIDRIRSVMGIASGCVAGICGLTGLQGFRKLEFHCSRMMDASMIFPLSRYPPHPFSIQFAFCACTCLYALQFGRGR